jgi:hypothetical protein
MTMTSRILSAAVIIGLMTPPLSPAFASGLQRHGMRSAKHVKLDRNLNTSAQHTTDGRGFRDEPYAGYRTDIAGNRYFYYRVGGDTPFGPGRALRPPYPR